jgi:hypothetical protein
VSRIDSQVQAFERAGAEEEEIAPFSEDHFIHRL